jgi:hypothetical protein
MSCKRRASSQLESSNKPSQGERERKKISKNERVVLKKQANSRAVVCVIANVGERDGRESSRSVVPLNHVTPRVHPGSRTARSSREHDAVVESFGEHRDGSGNAHGVLCSRCLLRHNLVPVESAPHKGGPRCGISALSKGRVFCKRKKNRQIRATLKVATCNRNHTL